MAQVQSLQLVLMEKVSQQGWVKLHCPALLCWPALCPLTGVKKQLVLDHMGGSSNCRKGAWRSGEGLHLYHVSVLQLV